MALSWPISSQPDRVSDDSRNEMEKFFRKAKVFSATVLSCDSIELLITRCSSLNKLLRCLAYVLRWLLPSVAVKPGVQTVGEADQKDRQKN